nr:NFX1-type zinc finger-containing protein 1 isoform X1 [Ciona intestinalis]XP_026691317.1 NFX1-type zinc finger-containing protein 1 isoform X1 [Ciona intestinalis]|eukprot:XP_018668369.2 NFX1-type zinc finger-containing protein 1 isoform X1 [Ciona intestinalis]
MRYRYHDRQGERRRRSFSRGRELRFQGESRDRNETEARFGHRRRYREHQGERRGRSLSRGRGRGFQGGSQGRNNRGARLSNGHRSRSPVSRDKTFNIRDLDQIVEMAKRNSTKALTKLLRDKEEFLKLLQRQMLDELKASVLDLCGKIAQIHGPRESLVEVSEIIIRSEFILQIISLLDDKLHTENTDNFWTQLLGCVRLINMCHTYTPQQSCDQVTRLIQVLKTEIDKLPQQEEHFKRIIQHLMSLSFSVCEVEENTIFERFRLISVLPTLDDITSMENPVLRPNQVDLPYQSLVDYLDVQFRLLREDFVQPFRTDIRKLKQLGGNESPNEVKNLTDITVYQDVRILFPEPTNYGIHYHVQFNVKNIGEIDWANSKCLQSANLLYFSNDNFKENVLFGVITKREPKELRKGFFEVKLLAAHNIHFLGNGHIFSSSYTVVESQAFFEAYHHVLFSLQEMQTLPLSRYIVGCDKNVLLPMYQMKNKHDFLFDHSKWLSDIHVNLDDSQKFALQTSLANEIALIQGPPGTGKTYIGLLMMRALLRMHGGRNPILVVCYTNHALDQFLEGIIDFHDKRIIRMGGQCKSEKLKQYQFNNVKTKKRIKARYEQIDDLKRPMKNETVTLNASTSCILSLSVLKEVIPTELFQQFVHFFNQEKHNLDTALLQWLGFCQVQNLTPYSYVIEEVLEAWARSFRSNYTKDQIKQAINLAGTLDYTAVANCLIHNGNRTVSSDSIAEIVYSFLVFEELPSHIEPLLECFNEVEVKCAVYVLIENQKDNDVSLEDVINWLVKKCCLKDNNATFEEIETWLLEQCDVCKGRQVCNEYKQGIIEKMLQRRMLAAASYTSILRGSQQMHSNNTRRIKLELNNTTTISFQEMIGIKNIRILTFQKKWKLYRLWAQLWRMQFSEKIENYAEAYNKQAAKWKESCDRQDCSVLETADVIGMTTSFAAKYRSMLHELPIKVVLVEEAGEVLEGHIVASLPKTTEHLILIGDHQQLKPPTTVYELALKMNLDVSLFERLVRNGLPFAQLTCQHRMKPRIADLIRPHIYKTLTDNNNVKNYKEIAGVEKSVFFISHEEKEEMVDKSKMNLHEAEFLVALCKYFLQFEYSSKSITILTTYRGQMLKIRKIMQLNEEKLKNVKVAVVDNYQGEENDILLLSLVRSNDKGNIGFLKTHNRVCVALSRAKKGLFCIGNMKLLRKESQLWNEIVSNLETDGSIGDGLVLKCAHLNSLVVAKTAADFKDSCGGSCGKQCKFPLECGHFCLRKCHPDDADHERYKCPLPCLKSCEERHKCLKKCWENVGLRPVFIDKIMPECGHTQTMKCGVNPQNFSCLLPCTKVLPCGHRCMLKCGVQCGDCEIFVEKIMPECGHTQTMKCGVNPQNFSCLLPCTKVLPCGHRCMLKCGVQCGDCEIFVEKTMPECGHQQEMPCHIDATLLKCYFLCDKLMSCGHTHMNARCHKTTCDKIMIQVYNRCKHRHVVPCYLHEESFPCRAACDMPLICGHACTEYCGEPCPILCNVCLQDPECRNRILVKQFV